MIRRSALVALALLSGVPFASLARAQEVVPRTIIALYDNRGKDDDIQNTYTHLLAEMPLNHLGLNLEYHEIHSPLPDLSNRPDVRGVLTWFLGDTRMDAAPYLQWAFNAVNTGKKYVIMGSLGVGERNEHATSLMNRFLGKIGIRTNDAWVDNPFDVRFVYNDPSMFLQPAAYERKLPPYPIVETVDQDARAHLVAQPAKKLKHESVLVMTSPRGGYAASGYIFRTNERAGEEIAQWTLDPFDFFRAAYATDDLPKPDTTTLMGRRIFYSNIDGDGWNNITQIEEYRGKDVICARVILEKIAKVFSDLPITVSAIAAEIDPKWIGNNDSAAVARELYALPQIEAGSHTYSHPLYWAFFKDNDPNKELPYLHLYADKTWGTKEQLEKFAHATPPPLFGYTVPRAYAREPYDVHKEIGGSIQKISEELPKGKRVEAIAWSGNCSPSESAVHLTRVAHVQNINGGDTRADPDYPGYASVAPIGKQVGNERQIYISTSNENTYTNLWSENFFAHRYLKTTLRNTETPMRLKPLTVYFHMYAGEKVASLDALAGNLEYARHQNIIPITTSAFTRVAEGFFETQLTLIAPDQWRVERRGTLNTIRFDRHLFSAVDFARSDGVLGQRLYQGSLYVALDPEAAQPVIALKPNKRWYEKPADDTPYLVESNWTVSGLKRKGMKFEFKTQGFGAGEIVWQAPQGEYRVTIHGVRQEMVTAAEDRLVKVRLPAGGPEPVLVTIERIDNARVALSS